MNLQERDTIIRTLDAALLVLKGPQDEKGPLSEGLIPESGMDIAYALPNARERGDVAAVRGGIGCPSDLDTSVERIAFGTGEEATRTVLSAMKFDPSIRSVATLRCTTEILDVMEDLFFAVCSFNPQKVPPGISVMEWGVAFCCREGVPDAIYNEQDSNIEAVVRLLAEDPLRVVNNIIKISARIQNRAIES
ncbi:MAG TPA: thiamine-phosphate synthase family protein [Methanomicrobiales archaeon]|nr:thiamine-phosphate synthase family protein [Methanomicrobiales archaeon]